MRKIALSLSVMITLLLFSVSAHSQVASPHFSYKIELKSDGYYYASMKSDIALSLAAEQTNISTIQYTLVAPIGTFAPVAQTGNTMTNVAPFEDLLPSTNSGQYSWIRQRTAFNATTEYGFFSLPVSVILTDIVANVDIPLFRFRTQSCLGDVRMYRVTADASGPADTKKLNSGLSITISGVNGGLNEAYKNNYGTAASCPSAGTPDVTTSISGPTTATPNVAYSYTVSINNVGSVPTTGAITESISIPSGMTFNNGGGNGWVCNPSGPVVGPLTLTCTNNAPNIAASGSSSFPVSVTPTTTGSFSITGIVSGGGETNTGNNTATSNSTLAGCGISAGTLTKN